MGTVPPSRCGVRRHIRLPRLASRSIAFLLPRFEVHCRRLRYPSMSFTVVLNRFHLDLELMLSLFFAGGCGGFPLCSEMKEPKDERQVFWKAVYCPRWRAILALVTVRISRAMTYGHRMSKSKCPSLSSKTRGMRVNLRHTA